MIKIITSFVIILAAWFALASITYPPTQVSTNGGSTYATTYKFDFPAGSQSGTIFTLGVIPASYGGTGLSSVGSSGNILTSNGSVWVSSAPAYTGTVTSVNLTSASFPALQFNGGPITGSGVITASYSGTPISIAFGGTGQTTANSALNALLPSQTSQSGNFLTTNGTNASWASAGGGSGTVTSIATGQGLTGGPITTTGTISLAVPVGVASGGTGATTLAQYGVLLGNGTSAITDVAPSTASYALISAGASANPIFAQIDLAAGVRNTLPVANGGTGLTTAASNGVLYGSGTSAIGVTSAGTIGQVLAVPGVGSAPAFASIPGNSTILKAPTATLLTSTGSTTAYAFLTSSASVSAGCVFTNNGHSYTVVTAISSDTHLLATGGGSPSGSGTLTYSSGGSGCNGAANLTYTGVQTAATYTPPSSSLYVEFSITGPGAGGTCGGTSAGGSGSSGQFFTGVWTGATGYAIATGGSGSVVGGNPGGNGTYVYVAGNGLSTNLSYVQSGGSGSGGGLSTISTSYEAGGAGGCGGCGGGGGGGGAAGDVGVSATGPGGGGGGGGATATSSTSTYGGTGGSGGGCVKSIIATAGASTIYYTIGGGGSGGAGCTDGSAGGNGGNGIINFLEKYQ